MATTTTRLSLTKPDYTDVVDVAELNTNADTIDAAVGATVCTSSTRPGSPWTGQLIYETDTLLSFVYTGSAWASTAIGGTINTDGNPGTKIYVGDADPSGTYTLQTGDVWIEV